MKIGIIDQYPILRSGIALLLNENFKDVEILFNGRIQELFNLGFAAELDLIVMGVGQTRNSSTIEMIAEIKSGFPKAKLILYDEYSGQLSGAKYLSLGADGYLLKQNKDKELVDCISEVMNGEVLAYNLVSKKNYLRDNNRHMLVMRERARLTRKQQVIADYLVTGMRTSDIARKLGKKVSTISTVKNTILNKFKVKSIVELMEEM